ncbi:hypothetical protein EMIHUDRAFT_245919 [Emiliania huxleyi CCMP1516]|uniref:Fatty acid hydroxylase domain-containing protein n=2 Tax=Emiliania huxleyi TaxID=2903 RepID=A0A0D3IVE7_EMIH1|nr:hypothetical protein EMIHUDRAFT_245919 [Emiliania huxleyi CCMP1516]EOD15232.1 hypothetical protein EMIHUDRAFT_245919 [Emiliania huxleyi CCMP1516]|eukprot:XP_005767661.1 hypothetical protein EMIHUDRAFT_245919 [Emiliania huxleyi CCMP1516]
MDFLYASNATIDRYTRAQAEWPTTQELLYEGLLVAGSIFLAAALLELTVVDTVRSILKSKNGVELYAKAWLYNVVNHCMLAPIVYAVGVRLFASPSIQFTPAERVLHYASCVAIHSAGYYCTHRAMHTKTLYWAHKYHHRFNVHICPIAASAVTQVEYMFAYLIPFIIAGVLMQPVPMETIAVAGLAIGHINNLIHTPWLESLSHRVVPWIGVSTADHFDHHRKLTTNYAAPTINVDRLLKLAPPLERAASRLFAAFGKPVACSSKGA